MSCAYQDRLEFIADYVRGELPENEQETFEAHYLGCDECLNTLRFMEKTSRVMHHYGSTVFAPQTTWLDHLKIWWDELPQQWRRTIPALATYLVLIGIMSAGYYWFNSSVKNDRHLYRDHSGGLLPEHSNKSFAQIEHFDWVQPAASTINPSLFNKLAEIQPIYQAQQYRAAAERLTPVVEEYPESFEAHLFLGISQLHLDHAEAAIQNLTTALQLRPEHPPAQWYLAQGYLLQENLDKARQQLAALVKQQDPRFSELAKRCLEKINQSKK